MAGTSDWKTIFNNEINRGKKARIEGNEGMARVCARRAAGVVIKEYLHRQTVHLPRLSTVLTPGASALNHLKFFVEAREIMPLAQERARHFLLQLQPDHTLPGNPDLLEDAQWLSENLLGE